MKVSKIIIKNLFGITEQKLDDKSIEITGVTGAGKTSIIDAIKYALTNNSDRDYIVKNGSSEGEILIETDNGLVIDRKKRTNKSDYKSVKKDGVEVNKPESFLQEIFTPLQLNPVDFINMSSQEQNRVILDLIEFDWDLKYIEEKFGEIPPQVNYEQNILQVLNEIQAKDGYYYKKREDVNRDIRNKVAFIEDIVKDIPENYNAKTWEEYDLGEKYKKLNEIKEKNNLIERATNYKNDYDNKVKAINDSIDLTIKNQNEVLDESINKYEKEILELQNKIALAKESKEKNIALCEQDRQNKLQELNKGIEQADEILKFKIENTEELESEIKQAENMKKHLNEYNRMITMKKEVESLKESSKILTDKIDLARNLPAEILKEAKLPVEYLSIEDGKPLIKGLPINGLSEGEKLELCIDVTLSKEVNLKLILIDGIERLSKENRERVYKKCKEAGVQIISTRITDVEGLTIIEI